MKEEALRARYVKTVENVSEHARPLAPLRHGDHVMVYNQRGRHPKRWDNSGVVVETKPHDQYVVKISGSGRLTLRNRRFLRLYRQQDLVDSIPPIAQPTHDHDPSLELRSQHSSSPHVKLMSPQGFVIGLLNTLPRRSTTLLFLPCKEAHLHGFVSVTFRLKYLRQMQFKTPVRMLSNCLLYTSDAADE